MEYRNSLNQGVIRYIPNSIIHLTFDERFNWPIEQGIPDSVIYLSFGYYFDQDIKDILPTSLKYLRIKENFKGTLPTSSSIKIIRLSYWGA